jgi:Zn-dependent peptidase ImmA (M78 family)
MTIINGEVWKVLLVRPEHPCLLRSDGSYALGSCDDVTKTIYINETVSNYMVKKILCHELAHAAMFSYNIELSIE